MVLDLFCIKPSKYGANFECHYNDVIMTGEFLAQMASNMENISIWWHHHVMASVLYMDW